MTALWNGGWCKLGRPTPMRHGKGYRVTWVTSRVALWNGVPQSPRQEGSFALCVNAGRTLASSMAATNGFIISTPLSSCMERQPHAQLHGGAQGGCLVLKD